MKKIVILGANGGIGNALWKHFDEHEKYDVCGFGRSVIDVTKVTDFEKLPDKIDCLINCAGYFNEEDPKKMYAVNYQGALNSIAFPVFHNKMNKGSYIFVLTSSAGVRHNPHYPMYSITKALIERASKHLAEDAMNLDVFVNTIAPCRVRTEMRSNITKDWKTELALEPEEVAEFIYNLYEADLRLYGHTFDLTLAYKRK